FILSVTGCCSKSALCDFYAVLQCRICALADDLVRVLLLRNGTLKEPRTWMVAPANVDVPWEGRDRLDVGGFPRPEFAVSGSAGEITLVTAKLSLGVTLRPFGLRWTTGRKSFARGRPTCSSQ